MKIQILRSGLLLALAALSSNGSALTLGTDFNVDYTATSLGSIAGLPTNYGGLTFKLGDPNTILIGGAANTASGLLYEVAVTRDANNHITGFSGTPMAFGTVGEFIDGGVTYGPNDVLFTAQWPSNNLGQTKPGSSDEDRVDALGALGIGGSSISAVGFVPTGFSNAGAMKVVSWSAGNWYDVAFAPDGAGTFDLTSATQVTTLPGGPEGFVYVDGASAGFGVDSLLVSDYSSGRISAYQVDANGDPLVATRRDFITGLTGAEGAVIDPLTGDFLFSTFGGANQVIVVQGFTFGIGEITGLKWEDLNGDGVLDAGEPLLAGWNIELLDAGGNVVETTTTDGSGAYFFSNLTPGQYGVREVMQTGWLQTADTTNGSLLTVAVGQVIGGVNFGNRMVNNPPPPPPPQPGVPVPAPLLLIGLGLAALWSGQRRAMV